jgi:prepilin-type N-terminal cleavage/methylation domain-containing protein
MTKSNKAFTLIEVVLAVAILASLSITIASSISQALKAKKKIQAEVTDVSSLRDTMKVLRADIHQAYNHVDFEKEISDQVNKPNPQQNVTAGPSSRQQQGPLSPTKPRENKREDPRTEFWGTENKLNFITMNNGRMTASDLQADFVEVGYELKACRNLSKPEQNSQCLYRRIQKILDKDIEKGGLETVILENITEFNLRYLVEGKEDWIKEWKSSGGLTNAQSTSTGRSIFPDAVEVTLAIEREFDSGTGPKKKKYSLQYVIPLHFPNNLKPTTPPAATGGSK